MAGWGMAAGAVLSYLGSRDQTNAARDSGHVDITHQTTPYGQAEPYMDAGAVAAYRALYGNQPQLLSDRNPGTPFTVPQIPLGGGTGGTGGQGGLQNMNDAAVSPEADPRAAWRQRRRAGAAPSTATGGPRNPVSPPAAPAAPSTRTTSGQSGTTSQAIANANRIAADMETSGTTRAAQTYTQNTLNGVDNDPYRQDAADYLRNLTDNPDYRRYLDSLFASDTGLGNGGGTGSSAGRQSFHMYIPQVTAAQVDSEGPTGAAGTIKSILAGNDTPGAQAMRERVRHQADDAFNENLRQRRLEAAGSGMYGGTGHLTDEAFAQARYGTGVADALAQQDWQLYSQALGLGTAYDTSALDRAARANSEAAAARSSGAAIDAELSSRERLARLDALGGAIGMGVQNRQYQAGGFGSLGSDFSGAQTAALNRAGDVNGMGQAGWLSAGGLSLGSDQAQNAWTASQNQLRASLANTSVDRGRLAFDTTRYTREAPLNDVALYQSIINGTYSPYSTSREYGIDQRAGSPALPNTGQQVLAGAAAGYSLGSNWGH